MPIGKEILSMFELSRNPKIALSVDNHFNECALSRERSVPTDLSKPLNASVSTIVRLALWSPFRGMLPKTLIDDTVTLFSDRDKGCLEFDHH